MAAASATVKATTAASTMESAACGNVAASRTRTSAGNSGSRCYAAMDSAGVTWACAVSAAISVSATNAVAAAEAISAVAPAVAIAPAVPRSNAEKDAAIEPVRPIISIRRTGIRVVRVIAVVTGRGPIRAVTRISDHRGTDSNTHSNLGVCRDRERHSQKHCE